MNFDTLSTMIVTTRTDEAVRVDLNDWAVNTLRDFAQSMGWSKAQVEALLTEEFARISGAGRDLVGYLRAVRSGSHFRLARGARSAIYAIYATRNGQRFHYRSF